VLRCDHAKEAPQTRQSQARAKASVLKIEGGWINAVDKALAKKRPRRMAKDAQAVGSLADPRNSFKTLALS